MIIYLAAFLLVVGPIVLIGAHREGIRRRAQRKPDTRKE